MYIFEPFPAPRVGGPGDGGGGLHGLVAVLVGLHGQVLGQIPKKVIVWDSDGFNLCLFAAVFPRVALFATQFPTLHRFTDNIIRLSENVVKHNHYIFENSFQISPYIKAKIDWSTGFLVDISRICRQAPADVLRFSCCMAGSLH